MDKALGGWAAWEVHGRCLDHPLCTSSSLGIQMVPAVFIRNQFAEQSLESPRTELTFANDRLRHAFLHRPLRWLLSPEPSSWMWSISRKCTCVCCCHISSALRRAGAVRDAGRRECSGQTWQQRANALPKQPHCITTELWDAMPRKWQKGDKKKGEKVSVHNSFLTGSLSCGQGPASSCLDPSINLCAYLPTVLAAREAQQVPCPHEFLRLHPNLLSVIILVLL